MRAAVYLAFCVLGATGCDSASARGSASGAPAVGVSAAPAAIDFEVPDFSLVDQKGRPVAKQDLAGKVLVVDFIFTRCPTVCPRLTDAMAKVGAEVATEERVRLVSITVDPENDSPDVLAEYAARWKADPQRWLFLTGEPEHVKATVLGGFKMAMRRSGAGTIDHAERFLVVDPRMHVRGVFDADEAGIRAIAARARELARD